MTGKAQDDFEDDGILSDEHIAFIKERINDIETSNQPTYLVGAGKRRIEKLEDT